MNSLLRLYASLERTFLAFAELNCDCGAKEYANPKFHQEYCPYWQAINKASDPENAQR
jgi:hypothetical protein